MNDNKKFWGMLLHLSMNMWNDQEDQNKYCPYESKLSCHMPTWRSVIDYMSECGLNMVVIDLGDAVQYETHPENRYRGCAYDGRASGRASLHSLQRDHPDSKAELFDGA